MVLGVILVVLFALGENVSTAVVGEKECSKFDYEYRVLERIIFLENKNAELQKQQTILERKNEELVEIVKEQRLEMERRDEELADADANMMVEIKNYAEIQNSSVLRLEETINRAKSQTEQIQKLQTSLLPLINETRGGSSKSVLLLAQLPHQSLPSVSQYSC